jgi:hypothetical protein
LGIPDRVATVDGQSQQALKKMLSVAWSGFVIRTCFSNPIACLMTAAKIEVNGHVVREAMLQCK